MSAEAASVIEPIVVTEPGVYLDLPDVVYHSDPVPGGSLSHSGSKLLLPPSCPALFKHARENGRPDKPQFDFGHAAHFRALGTGPEIVSVDATDWRTNKAKDAAKEARARGAVPLLAEQVAVIEEMATALRAHPTASALIDPDNGTPEVSLFHVDARSGVMLRSRLDWLRNPNNDGRLILVDYKTSVSADGDHFARAAFNFGYHSQDVFYTDMAAALELAEDIAFLFIVQEKTPPYLVNVIGLDSLAQRIGRGRNRKAIDIYADCVATDTWPGYGDGIEYVSLPAWAERNSEEYL